MAANLNLHSDSKADQLISLKPLLNQLKQALSFEEKLRILDMHPAVQEFVNLHKELVSNLCSFTPEEEFVIKSVAVIGQADLLFRCSLTDLKIQPALKILLDQLLQVQSICSDWGGVIGYHVKILELLKHNEEQAMTGHVKIDYKKPIGLDLSGEREKTAHATLEGLRFLKEVAEIYPIGGAGDRLGLISEDGLEPLPAALLEFCGRTLIEGLIRDVQAKEYLFFKVFNEQVTLPIAMMTSEEKNNHSHILSVFEKHRWFGRSKESFRFFKQPLVPVVNSEGEWMVVGPLQLMLKPGGHGVVWKLAEEKGVFEWLKKLDKKKMLVRQINNPISGLDEGLLAFMGWGSEHGKEFGFLSCPRRVGSAEGVLVLEENQAETDWEYRISNLEYTSFPKYGLKDIPDQPGGIYSRFPSNSNILFVDLDALRRALHICSIPGILINIKPSSIYSSDGGGLVKKEVVIGRIESTMQNISDYLVHKEDKPLSDVELIEKMPTYVVYNKRNKTISVTKKSYLPGQSSLETPEGAYYDLLANMRELLVQNCMMSVPELGTVEEYLAAGPNFIFLYHPALGPLFSVIAQKIRGGVMKKGAELQLEIAELDLENLDLDGSLLIEAANVFGKEEAGFVKCSNRTGKCTLTNVKVRNLGRQKRPNQIFWKNRLLRHEYLKITIEGSGELVARDLTFEGQIEIRVPDGCRLTVHQTSERKLVYTQETLKAPSWEWVYSISQDETIKLTKHNY